MTLFNGASKPFGPDDIGEELPRVEGVLYDSEDAPEYTLNDWDCEFLESLSERVAQYGAYTRMTEKQWEAFERIEGKLYGGN